MNDFSQRALIFSDRTNSRHGRPFSRTIQASCFGPREWISTFVADWRRDRSNRAPAIVADTSLRRTVENCVAHSTRWRQQRRSQRISDGADAADFRQVDDEGFEIKDWASHALNAVPRREISERLYLCHAPSIRNAHAWQKLRQVWFANSRSCRNNSAKAASRAHVLPSLRALRSESLVPSLVAKPEPDSVVSRQRKAEAMELTPVRRCDRHCPTAAPMRRTRETRG